MIYLGVFIGGFIGGYIPALWGADVFSIWSLSLGTIGGFLGIWIGYKVGQNMGL